MRQCLIKINALYVFVHAYHTTKHKVAAIFYLVSHIVNNKQIFIFQKPQVLMTMEKKRTLIKQRRTLQIEEFIINNFVPVISL